ncbi:MAG: hypothetical protein IAE97_12795 [Chthoniobacterales bacterium]|nr:hypothetical protein [Chthoniobacterales bacterium]
MTARKFFRGLGLVAAAMGLLLVVAWGAWLLIERSRLEAMEAKIRAEGLAMTLEEVLPPPVALEDNAAPLLEKAAVHLAALKDAIAEARFLGSGDRDRDPSLFDAEKLSELKARMTSPEVQSVLDLLRKASAKPACQFDRDYSRGFAVKATGMTEILSGAQLLRLSSWLRARDGDITGAFDDLMAIIRLAGFGLEDPLLIGWLVGVAAETIGIQTASEIFGKTSPGQLPADQFRELQHLWVTCLAEAREKFVRKLDAERVISMDWAFRTVYPRERLKWFLKYPLYPFVLMDQRAYPESMLTLRDRILTKKPGELPVDDKDLEQVPRFALLTRLGLGAVGSYRQHLDEYQTSLQVAQVGLVLEEWRRSHTDYPSTLGELGVPPEMLRDPFSDQPLIYRRTPEGVTVYSVGKDRADNGGIRRKKDQPGDVVWSVQRPAP